MRPTIGHITADALARVYAGAYDTEMPGSRDARAQADAAVRHFVELVEELRGEVVND